MRKVTSLGDIVNYRRGDIDEDRYNISRRRIVLDKDMDKELSVSELDKRFKTKRKIRK